MNQVHLGDWFQNTLAKHGNKPAIKTDHQVITYEELRTRSIGLASRLLTKFREPNEKVAILVPNSIEYVMIDLSIMFSGGTRVAMNTMLSEKEIYYILKDSEATTIFVDKDFLYVIKKIEEKLRNLRHIILLNSNSDKDLPQNYIRWEDFQEDGQKFIEFDRSSANWNEALIAYTGGTTGYPKGAVYSHHKVFLILLSHMIELELKKDDKLLLTSPFPHSAGMILLAGLLKGATHYIEKKFNPEKVIKLFEQEKITFAFMVPTMIYRIIDQIGDKKITFKSLRTILYGAAPMAAEKLKQAIEIFGPVFIQLYGQTESYNFITRLKKEDHIAGLHNETRLSSCGQSVLLSNVKIVNKKGQELSTNEIGEVIVISPYNMDGYYKNKKKTDEALINGWLYTGDIGYKDHDGFLYLLDRRKDMIISGGMNVYSSEVEKVIQQHPSVSNVAVIGRPHDDWGEAVMAVIVQKEGRPCTKEEILSLCKKELGSYKIPKFIEFIEELPLTPYGKIDKKSLRQMYSN